MIAGLAKNDDKPFIVLELYRRLNLLTTEEKNLILGVFYKDKSIDEMANKLNMEPIKASEKLETILGTLRKDKQLSELWKTCH